MVEIDCSEFRLMLPGGAWTNHSTSDAYDYRLADEEQLMAVVHLPKQVLDGSALIRAVTELFRVRLDTVQKHSQNTCRFEPPDVVQLADKFDATVIGHDLANNFFMQIGFFGRPHKTIVISYYDYTRRRNLARFRGRTKGIMDSVVIR